MSRVFIAYGGRDYATAEWLYEGLLAAGHSPFLAPKSLRGGTEWRKEIRIRIARSRFFVPLLSRHSLSKRGYVQAEIRQALNIALSFPPNTVYLIPVRLEPCTPRHEGLKERHWVDLFPERRKTALNELLSALPRRKRVRSTFYAESGLVIPPRIREWSPVRQDEFVARELWQACLDRAHKAYENVPLRDAVGTVLEYARILLMNAGGDAQIPEACDRFLLRAGSASANS